VGEREAKREERGENMTEWRRRRNGKLNRGIEKMGSRGE